MEEIIRLIDEILEDKNLIQVVVSNLRRKDGDGYNKVDIKPVIISEELKYQFTYYYENKVLHENLSDEDFKLKLLDLLEDEFRQAMIFTKENDFQILISKKKKVKILRHKPSKKEVDLSHDRVKEYILKDNEKIDFLIELGVMDKNGRVIPRRYDKFRQINRFLEFVEDIIGEIDKGETINIIDFGCGKSIIFIDFGCGKSYLTFALYYYLVNILKLDVNIVGLDLKKEVIDFCNKVAEKLNYENLKFLHGDIKDYNNKKDVDMVVTLHACDTATDAAIVKAINWNAKAILSVPCCQHEFFDKIENDKLNPMLKYGIVKDKLSSLVTDSLRGLVLESEGYKVQLLEFIDMEHTPKNILIRAVKSDQVDRKLAEREYEDFKKFWNLEDIYIEEALKNS